MNRIRGFEKISLAQFTHDIKPLENISLEEEFEQIQFPKRATNHSAGYDVFTFRDIILNPGAMKVIPTGIKTYMQNDEWFSIQFFFNSLF